MNFSLEYSQNGASKRELFEDYDSALRRYHNVAGDGTSFIKIKKLNEGVEVELLTE
jgi:hypothetical protein